MIAASQLTLAFAHDPSWQRGDFIIGAANRLAVHTIDNWPHGWPARILVLTGASGSGKTHLAAVWARMSHAMMLSEDKLDGEQFDRHGEEAAFVLELRGLEFDEQALFHVLNRVKECRQWLLLTARTAPQMWGVKLADLRSRLTSAPLVELGEPDDALLEAILFKQFTDRQMMIDLPTLRFLVARMERTPAAAARLAGRIDNLALNRKRRTVTKLLVTRALAIEDSDMDER
jgi:chromosomal replication initiation ATPase DnaA